MATYHSITTRGRTFNDVFHGSYVLASEGSLENLAPGMLVVDLESGISWLIISVVEDRRGDDFCDVFSINFDGVTEGDRFIITFIRVTR